MARRHCEATLINIGLPRTGTTSLHVALQHLLILCAYHRECLIAHLGDEW